MSHPALVPGAVAAITGSAAGDIVENRPPLSRWQRDLAEAFARFAEE